MTKINLTARDINQCTDMKETIQNWAEAINVVNEKNPSQKVVSARKTARTWILEAANVYMAGFALSAPNAKMLGLGSLDCEGPQLWQVHNYDGSAGLKFSASSYERDKISMGADSITEEIKVLFAGGTTDAPMSIANWFQIGVPGELPG